MFSSEVKKIRESQGISQAIMCARIGVSQGNYSKYENDKLDIPEDIAVAIIRELGSPRLMAIYRTEKNVGLINIKILNNVDQNANTVLDVLIEEAEELIENAAALKKLIRNKNCIDDLSEQERIKLVKHELQIADLIPAIDLHFIRMSEVFGLDLKHIEKCMKMKLKDKKYLVE